MREKTLTEREMSGEGGRGREESLEVFGLILHYKWACQGIIGAVDQCMNGLLYSLPITEPRT